MLTSSYQKIARKKRFDYLFKYNLNVRVLGKRSVHSIDFSYGRSTKSSLIEVCETSHRTKSLLVPSRSLVEKYETPDSVSAAQQRSIDKYELKSAAAGQP